MQEEIDQKTIALAVKTGKLTAQVLQAAIRKYLAARQKGTGKTHHGQQSLRQLKKDGSALSNIEITDANIGLFKPCAKKYDIDFTLRKDRTTHPPRYIVIFKSKQADNLEQAFKEFTAKKLQQQERPSIRKTLAVLKEKAAARSSQQASPLKWWCARSSSAASSSPRRGPTRPTTLIPPLCGNPKWKRRSTLLSKKQKNETSAKAPVKLTRAEKKEIQAVIRKYKGDGKPHSAQASIPYEAMYQDGVCRVTPRTFSKCIEFTDISYQLAQADTKTAIFENLCDLYNYLDASIHVQFSFINRKIDPKQYAKSFEIRAQGDDFDDIRSEYSGILQDQLVNGNNGLMKRKFMTYTIEADSLKMARARLRRIETDLLGYFKGMGASAWGLDAKERLEVMHSIFHPDGEPFSFDWKWLAPSGLSTKDFIAPSSFRFGNARMFGLGGKYGAVSFLQILSPELSDEMLADFLNTENGIVVNLHVQAIDQSDAIKTVKRKITDLDAMKIQEQKRAVRSGYDMDILPSDLARLADRIVRIEDGKIVE